MKANSNLHTSWDDEGVSFTPQPANPEWLSMPLAFGPQSELALLLNQLSDEGFVECDAQGAQLSWEDFYRLAANPEHASSVGLLQTPSIESWKPVLTSKDGLSDKSFSVSIAGWVTPEGARYDGDVQIHGAVLTAGNRVAAIPEAAWLVTNGVADLWALPQSSRSADSNRQIWSSIRAHAIDANADMTDFLRKTVVLAPQRLQINLRKGSADAVEVMPTFDGAPTGWLDAFDKKNEVPERYEIADGEGMVHVLVSPEVRTVLREIRRMPGRRIAGSRAEAFVRNPFAALGPDASAVIDPEEFEKARDDAGIGFATFTAFIDRENSSALPRCKLLIAESLHGETTVEEYQFEDVDDLARFLKKLNASIKADAQCCHWEGYDLEILGDTPEQARILQDALDELQNPGGIKAKDIFNISRYSDRIEGFGTEKAYYSPFITKKSDEAGWVPENVGYGICITPIDGGDAFVLPLGGAKMKKFKEAAERAISNKQDTFTFPDCPDPIPVEQAKELLKTFEKVGSEIGGGKTSIDKPPARAERTGLVVKPNLEALDYEERRGALNVKGATAKLPESLRPDVELKEHQLAGVAWLQHMWRHSPEYCRGALLADDMGLGKTIQLLTFIAGVLEDNPDGDPFLVVAPVSLLENWKEEIGKFFVPGAMNVLTLYGQALSEKRAAKKELDADLISADVTRLLKRGWLGSAKVVLTTYETLRDLEFSLAAQKWSAMICDEAQKIKNPNALVSRSAKKQNARLKIACTGTPVENTLTDIWCLFDFMQPGLLGALKDFGERFRRPIETDADEEGKSLAELRELIEPQKLRRMKFEVAKDLPNKIEDIACRSLQMSSRQRQLYGEAVAIFQQRGPGRGTELQSPLGLIQYIRKLCTDPRPFGQLSNPDEPIDDLEARSPKMKWLNETLTKIKKADEKAIVFCEFKDVQRTLQRAVNTRHGYLPEVINGDTSTDTKNEKNRQAVIRKFQEKPGFGVIILSPIAVGFGVNIQGANHVIHFSRTWNPAKEDQATDRAYRIGQTKDVYVYYPTVVAHDFLSFDAKLDLLLTRKRALSTDMLKPAGDLDPADFADLPGPGGGSAFGNELIDGGQIGSMAPKAFEALCAVLWSKQGFVKTATTKASGDGGVDVVAIKGAEGVLMQCKSSNTQGKLLGWEALKDVFAGAPGYAAKYPGVTFSLLAVTNQRFNESAKSQAKHLNVKLLDCDDFVELLNKYSTKTGELAKFWMK